MIGCNRVQRDGKSDVTIRDGESDVTIRDGKSDVTIRNLSALLIQERLHVLYNFANPLKSTDIKLKSDWQSHMCTGTFTSIIKSRQAREGVTHHSVFGDLSCIRSVFLL